MGKKLKEWQRLNHPDKGGSTELSQNMNERVAALEVAVEGVRTRREEERMRQTTSVLESRMAKRREKEEQERREREAAAAAEAPPPPTSVSLCVKEN